MEGKEIVKGETQDLTKDTTNVEDQGSIFLKLLQLYFL